MAREFEHLKGQYLEVNGADIYYEEIGDSDKPVILLLHGGFESIEDMNQIAGWIPDSYRILGIDTRGHGKSTLGSKPLTYELIQSDIEAVLEYMKIDELSIIGFSDGGVVAYRTAASGNFKIDKLITIGASWCQEDVIGAEKSVKSITPESAKEIFSSDYKNYMKLNPEGDFEKFATSVLAMWMDKTEAGHPDHSVDAISAKTLLIRGDNDLFVSLESLNNLKKRLKDAELLNLPFAGHVVFVDQPEIVGNMMKQFL